MYANSPPRLAGFLDELITTRDEMLARADPSTELEQVCVWTNRGQTGEGCPPGYEWMDATVADFQEGGVFAEGGGGKYSGNIIERGLELGDSPPVELGLEYEPTRAGVGSSAPLLNYLAIGAVGLALLFSRKR